MGGVTEMTQDAFVISAEGHEISQSEFRHVLRRYLRQQEMMVNLGPKRKPDRTDRLSITVKKDGKVEKGWWMQEVQCNRGGAIGEMYVAFAFKSTGFGVWVSYDTHTQELRSVPTRIPQPVYP